MHDGMNILAVEDEPKIARILVDYLQPEGYEVDTLEEGSTAVEFIRSQAPDSLILDLMLPGKDGLGICREVRQFSQMPIMMLTAKIDEIDRLLGLELGAHDYVCKPFSPREVVARVKSILRRTQLQPVQVDGNEVVYRDITLYPDRFQVVAGGVAVELTAIEFRPLQALMSRPGHVFSRDRLMTLSYTDGRIVSDRTIDPHLQHLRRKLHSTTAGEELLHSIYGVGYKVE